MDKIRLLEPQIQSFIKEHEDDDLRHLMLQKEKYAHLPLRDIIEQLGARRKAEKKLPTRKVKCRVTGKQTCFVLSGNFRR